MKILILSLLMSPVAFAFDPVVTIEYDVKRVSSQSDILFVIDNSGSMNDYQNTLSEISEVFVDELGESSFKITAISTDGADDLETSVIDSMTSRPVDELAQLIKSFGINGTGDEIPFNRLMAFYNSSAGKKFFRKETSKKEVILLTDEDDGSEVEMPDFKSFLNTTNTILSALAIDPKHEECNRRVGAGERVAEAVRSSGGLFVDICNVTRESLINKYKILASSIAKRATTTSYYASPVRELDLPAKVDLDSIEVFYGKQTIKRGFVRSGWVFDEASQKLLFGTDIRLSISEPAGTKFTIRYNIL